MVALNDISKSYSVRPLNEGETLNSFNCGDEELNEFILSKASEYKKTLLAVSYVLEENGNPIAYFALSNDNLSAEIFESKTNFNRQMRKRFVNEKRRKHFPAVKIGRLAVDLNSDKKGVGSALLYTIKYTLIDNQKSGCRFITVDAYNDAIGFYEKNGFVMVNAFNPEKRTQPMFFDLAQLL
ncbi:MAG: GNAT family N-acetyltransferase [Paludibacteraceae bacterium]|jgi:GNAT superfamily N-acetyltransferase|nr:GNAT family N-acetyltransferase [Paludibacteraceae bacterium]MBR2493811.1 GNAT family N-acetyltransferase [Paludibacteraceae bacterium]MBR6687064.1 GNAT family N-acetyltransferase [Paludibacteraceae bacterium]